MDCVLKSSLQKPLTFLKQNDKCLQMLLETSMGMLGTKTLLPVSVKLLKVFEIFHKLLLFKALPEIAR